MPPEDRHSGVPGGGGGANVKSGRIDNVDDGVTGSVTYVTAFSGTPEVVLTLQPLASFGNDTAMVVSRTGTGFGWRIVKNHGGSGHTYNLEWIATDAGDP